MENLQGAVLWKRAGERSKNEGVGNNTIDSRKDTEARNNTCMLALAIMTNKGHR